MWMTVACDCLRLATTIASFHMLLRVARFTKPSVHYLWTKYHLYVHIHSLTALEDP